MRAADDLQPVLLDFGNDDLQKDILLSQLDVDEGLVDGDCPELPEPDESRLCRAVYQRFLSAYRRWTQKQLSGQIDDASHAILANKLKLAGKTPRCKIRLAQEFWSDPGVKFPEADQEAMLAVWKAKEKIQNAKKDYRWFRGSAGLWTYTGDWGIMEEIAVPMTRSASEHDEITDVVLQCQNSKRLLELWTDFVKFWKNRRQVSLRALRLGL